METKVFRDREILTTAQARGRVATLGAYFRLSGPGWLQSAITLGGSTLTATLYLGAIGGMSMLWVNFTAIFIGVIMLSAISYITLSTGRRPYAAINEFINPVLGVGWISATLLANMIFIMAQYSLAYDIAKENFGIETTFNGSWGLSPLAIKILFSVLVGGFALGIVLMNFRPGWFSRLFDWLLKIMVGMIVLCFVLVVVKLFQSDDLNLYSVLAGSIPNLKLWFYPASTIAELLSTMEPAVAEHWSRQMVSAQQKIMVGAAATAVGINMTFLLPYSMLHRGWDKPFRGLARWDLITGMAIPFVVVTGCIVIASAHAIHGRVDGQFASADPEIFRLSPLFSESAETRALLKRRIEMFVPGNFASLESMPTDTVEQKLSQAEAEQNLLAQAAAALSLEEKKLAVALTKPNSSLFARSLEPVLGSGAKTVFGIGAFGMVFSTMIVLMLINGYALSEVVGKPHSIAFQSLGAIAAAIAGACWCWIWVGESRIWLSILVSNFGMILLPIAYFVFLLMMNNRALLGSEKPTGISMILWNILMSLGVIGALVPAMGSLMAISQPEIRQFAFGGIAVFLLLALVGFSARHKS
jgi:Mn2+/Fe2+ NRAMP family transporter